MDLMTRRFLHCFSVECFDAKKYFFDQELIATHLVLVVLLVGATSSKCLSPRRFKSDRDEIWQGYSSSKHNSWKDRSCWQLACRLCLLLY